MKLLKWLKRHPIIITGCSTCQHRGGYTVTWADRGENQREKSKVSPLLVSPYYTTLDCARTSYLVHTDPMLCGPLTDSGCMYASYFTSAVTLEVKVEQSSDLRAEQSLEMGVEFQPRGGVESGMAEV